MEKTTIVREMEMQLTADNSQRTGAYANSYLIRSNDMEAVIDFCFIDDMADKNDKTIASGVLTSRIIMTVDGLRKLRDAIDDHLQTNGMLLAQESKG